MNSNVFVEQNVLYIQLKVHCDTSQGCSISSAADALEILQSCTKALTWQPFCFSTCVLEQQPLGKLLLENIPWFVGAH